MKKIVIIGPESTGKSTLCAQLAAHYNTVWCPEYAREYLLKNGMDYSYEDLLTIAKGQLALEEEYEAGVESGETGARSRESGVGSWESGVGSEELDVKREKGNVKNTDSFSRPRSHASRLFIDTDMYVMKVWCEFVFGNCHRFILEQIVERKYDLYLLCNVDLPWVKDELREYPDLENRSKLYHIYKDIMVNQSVPWVDISGNYEERLEKAIEAVDKLL